MQSADGKFSDIKKLIFFAIAIGEATAQARAASGIIGRTVPFFDAVDETIALLGIDRDAAKAQWDGMTDADWDELLAESKLEFDLTDDDLEGKSERSFDHGLQVLRGFDALAAEWKSPT